MATILKTFLETYPHVKLVGKRYTDKDRDGNGSFGEKWGQWFQNDWFSPLKGSFEGISNNYVGAMRCAETGFEYWIGILLAPDDPVPQGYEFVDIPAGTLAVCYLYGRDGSADLFGMEAHEACLSVWQERGWTPNGWFLERYNCPRYTQPDEKGNVILDYCAYIAMEE